MKDRAPEIREANIKDYPEIVQLSINIWKQAYKNIFEQNFLATLSLNPHLPLDNNN